VSHACRQGQALLPFSPKPVYTGQNMPEEI
jgi:hypothetical protein